jgi:hypothetical protein
MQGSSAFEFSSFSFGLSGAPAHGDKTVAANLSHNQEIMLICYAKL